ncbi:MAG: TonB-dependent receptor [Rhodoferax sp.]|nr:TonB-dependent receptor [Rhodoferax sp.]
MKIPVICVRWAVSAFALAAAFSASAQSELAPQARVVQLEEVVVTATRVAQPLSDLVADVTILDRDTLERSGAAGLGDVLARVPGVEIARNGGAGGTTSVYVRGAETRFTAVYIDGVRVDSQSTGGANWQAIPLSQIDRVEVLRGPAAAVYGSDAMAGVIQIFTRKGESAFVPVASIGGGSFDTSKASLGFSGANQGVDYALNVANESSTGFNSRTIGTQNPDKDGYRLESASGRLGWQINPEHRLEATALTSQLNSQYDSGLTGDARSFYNLQAVGLNWQGQWNNVYSTKFSVSESRDKYETQPSPYLTVTTLRSYLLQNNFKLGAHLVTAALERKEDQLTNAPIDRMRSQDAVALGYGYNAGGHTVQLNWRNDSDSEFGAQGTGSVAYGYAFTPQWRATASTGSAFRAPTLYHRFSKYGIASLKPEVSTNVEAGLRYTQGSSNLGMVLYRNQVSNLITYVVGSGACQNGGPPVALASRGCYANTAEAEYTGMTVSGATRWGNVGVYASLDLQDPRDKVTGKLLPRRASQHGTVGLNTRVGVWTLGADAQLAGDRYDSAANSLLLPGYVLLNLTASRPVARDWTLQARVDNLLDKSYALASTYATQGQSLFVNLTWAPQ